MKPLVVIDTSVVAHNLYNRVDELTQPRKTKYPPRKMLDRIMEDAFNLYNTNYWADNLDTDIIWVGDSKPYWRKEVYPNYKTNRADHPDKGKFIGRFYKHIKPWSVLGFEADDLASAIVRSYEGIRKIILLTVDSDWIQMVNPNVTWVCAKGCYAPQYRDEKGAKVWFKNKIDKELKYIQPQIDTNNLRDIVKWKVIAGDKSDNIPCLRKANDLGLDFEPLIDLIDPQVDFLNIYGAKHIRAKVETNSVACRIDTDNLEYSSENISAAYETIYKFLPTAVCRDMRRYKSDLEKI